MGSPGKMSGGKGGVPGCVKVPVMTPVSELTNQSVLLPCANRYVMLARVPALTLDLLASMPRGATL